MWQITHIVGRSRNPAGQYNSLASALEYMSYHGYSDWRVEDPTVERMRLCTIGGRHRFEISNIGG